MIWTETMVKEWVDSWVDWGYGLLLGGYLLQCAARVGAAIAVLAGGVFLFL